LAGPGIAAASCGEDLREEVGEDGEDKKPETD
jgi:hypothetical protein